MPSLAALGSIETLKFQTHLSHRGNALSTHIISHTITAHSQCTNTMNSQRTPVAARAKAGLDTLRTQRDSIKSSEGEFWMEVIDGTPDDSGENSFFYIREALNAHNGRFAFGRDAVDSSSLETQRRDTANGTATTKTHRFCSFFLPLPCRT